MLIPSSSRFMARFASLSLAAALLSPALPPLAAQQSPPPAPATEEATVLEKIVIEGADVDKSVLPTRPNSAFYGFEELIQNTPRSIFQVTTAQIATDHFHNFSDLARYSPSVGRLAASNFSTYSYIRGGTADTTRNGVLLLPAAVRPFNNNYWESVDIVAGIPSVIQGSTVRTSGVVNYVTKKPVFDANKTDLTLQIGRLGADADTSYPQYTFQLDHNLVIQKDRLALRLSLQKTDAEQYWGNSKSDFYDLYIATTWKPLKNLTLQTNYNYTDAGGPMPYGVNRVDQNLIDNWQYRAGLYAPRITGYIDASGNVFTSNGAGRTQAYLYASREDPGLWARAATASRLPDASAYTLRTGADLFFAKDQRFSFTFQAPAADQYTLVPINGSQTLFNDRAFSDTKEHIFQNIAELRLNEHFTLRNNSLYHQVASYVFGSDGYHSYMINKMVTSRVEFTTDFEIGRPASWLQKLGLRHQSNSGYEFRYLWNMCDMVSSSNLGWSNTQDVTHPADGAGRLGYGTLLAVDNIYSFEPPPGSPDYTYSNGFPRYPVQTGYGPWITLNGNFYQGNGRYATLPGFDSMIRINQLYQNNLFTEQKLTLWKFFLRAGARITYINDFIKPTKFTDEAIDRGLVRNYTHSDLRDHVSDHNYDLNGSISLQPWPWLTAYAAWDLDYASNDCTCCLTMGYSTWGGKRFALKRSDFHRKSTLREFGGKFEIIPGKLFGTVAYYKQLRYTPQAPTDANPSGTNNNPTIYEGWEFSQVYQPDNHFNIGANFSILEVTTLNSATGRVTKTLTLPKHTGNLWVSYQFRNGLGLKASLWATSPWRAAGTATVHRQTNLDLGLFHESPAWRVDIDLLNATNEKNWAQGSNYSGNQPSYLLPAERLGLLAKITRRF
jgi:hypothetical protein